MFLRNLVFGGTTVLELFPTGRMYPSRSQRIYQPALSDLDALRGDWIKIGQNLSRVLTYESRNPERANSKRYKSEPARNVVGRKVVLAKEDFPSDQA